MSYYYDRLPGLDAWITRQPEDPHAEAYEHYTEEADRMGFDELVDELGEDRETLIEEHDTEENAVVVLREKWVEKQIDALRNPEPDYEPDDYYDDPWEDY